MGKAIGIDLGTTNTVAAIMEGPRFRILLTQAHESSTRSAVFMPNDHQPLVGAKAYDKAGADPENVVISVKRLVGRQYEDPEVQEFREHYHYRVEKNPDGSDIVIPLRGRNYTPTEISSMILKKVKQDAELRLGEEVTHAVITVPAYFDPIQKEQTRIAGEMAGFRVKKIISEPTAAAIAHSMDQIDDTPMTMLVYDLGGGTFDISCLLSQNGMHAELDIEGNMWMGGDNFDQAIVNFCLASIKKEYGPDPSDDRKFMFAIRKAAETAKKELGEMNSTDIMLPPLKTGSGTVDPCITISRAQFENEIHKDVELTVRLMETAMKNADVTPEQIDCVLLVGGSTAVPLVRDRLIQRFGEDKISQNIDAMTCVAAGAAKLARDLAGITCPNPDCGEPGGYLNPLDATACEKCGHELIPEITCACGVKNSLSAEKCAGCGAVIASEGIHQVIPQGIGIEVEGGAYEVIMPKNSSYPSMNPYTRQFVTAEAAQENVYIPVYQGECLNDVTKNTFLGSGEIMLGEKVPADTPVDVSIRLDRDGVLTCDARVHYGQVEPVSFRIDPRLGLPKREPGGDNGDTGPDTTDWRTESGLNFGLAVSGIILDRHAWILPSADATELERIRDRMKSADDTNNEADGVAAAADFKEWISEHGSAQILALADMVSGIPNVPADLRQNLNSCLGRVTTCASQNRVTEAKAAFVELERALDEAIAALPAGGGGLPEQVGKGTKVKVAGK